MDYIFIFLTGVLILFVLINIILDKYKFFKDMYLLKRNLLILFLSMISFLVVSAIFNNTLLSLDNKLFYRGIFTSIISVLIVVIYIYIGSKFTKLLYKNYNCEDKLKKTYSKLKDKEYDISNLRSQKHDYLKHLQVVYSLLNNNLNTDAKNYITNISNSLSSKKSRYGKVSYLDSIVSLKKEECFKKNIKFDAYIQDFIDNLNIEASDLSSVLLNIIDNAIDALSTTDKVHKYIKLSAYEDEFQYVISIENNGPIIYNTEGIFEEGFSTKDGENRGYGLYLVKNILDKYGYYIFANSDEFLTEFTILIPKYN